LAASFVFDNGSLWFLSFRFVLFLFIIFSSCALTIFDHVHHGLHFGLSSSYLLPSHFMHWLLLIITFVLVLILQINFIFLSFIVLPYCALIVLNNVWCGIDPLDLSSSFSSPYFLVYSPPPKTFMGQWFVVACNYMTFGFLWNHFPCLNYF
jgi:hypothetical protein